MPALVRAGVFAAGDTSFDTELGETPVAILLVSTRASDGDGPERSLAISTGAAITGAQWVASYTYPYEGVIDFNDDIETAGFDATKAILVFADDHSTAFTAEVDTLNVDGTVDLTWTGTPTGDVGFIAWSGIDVFMDVITLGGSLAGISSPQTVTPGFEARFVLGAHAGTGTSEGFIDSGWHIGMYFGDADLTTVEFDPDGVEGGLSSAVWWDTPIAIGAENEGQFQAAGGGIAQMFKARSGGIQYDNEVRWVVDQLSVTATDFDLTRIVNPTGFGAVALSGSVGLLVLGGPNHHSRAPTATDIDDAVPGLSSAMVPRGGIVLAEYGDPNAEQGVSIGAWDVLGNQWSACILATPEDQNPELSLTGRGFWDGRLQQMLSDPDTEVGHRVVSPTPGVPGDPSIALNGSYPSVSNFQSWWPTFIEPVADFGPVSLDALVFPQRLDALVFPGARG